MLARPAMTVEKLGGLLDAAARRALLRLQKECAAAVESLIVDARYAGYVQRQAKAVRQMQDLDGKLIPEDIEYECVSHLRHEAREKLSLVRPRSLGQAFRIDGITPADITVLAIHLAARRKADAREGAQGRARSP